MSRNAFPNRGKKWKILRSKMRANKTMTTMPKTMYSYTVWSTSLSTLQDRHGGERARNLCIADVLDAVVSDLSPTSLVDYVSL
jgi:hypothetical protein